MFKHVARRDGKYFIRRWSFLGFQEWCQSQDYWYTLPEGTMFDTLEDAREAYGLRIDP